MRASKSPAALLLSMATAFAFIATLGAASPVHAETGQVRVEWPTAGESLPGGSYNQVFWLDTSAAEPGLLYDFEVNCTNAWGYHDFSSSEQFTSSGPEGGSIGITAYGQLPQSGSCSARVVEVASQNATWLGDWTVASSEPPPPDPQPSPTLQDVRADASYFYPRVVDGFRDDANLTWSIANDDYQHEVTVTVLNSAGTAVRSERADYGQWSWDGRSDSGALVGAGSYQVRVSINAPNGGVAQEVLVPVQVRTDVVAQRRTLTKLGHQSSVAATRGCQASRDPDWDQNTMLDCWGGRYALAKYRFTIPSGAYSVTWGMRNVTTGADLCCSGRITKTGVRSTTKTSFTVTAKVTGWRAMDIRKATVTYTARVRR